MKIKYIITLHDNTEVCIKSKKALETYYECRGNRDCPVREVKTLKN